MANLYLNSSHLGSVTGTAVLPVAELSGYLVKYYMQRQGDTPEKKRARAHDPDANHWPAEPSIRQTSEAYTQSAEEPTRSPSIAWPGIESSLPFNGPHVDLLRTDRPPSVHSDIYKKGILRDYYLHRAKSTIPVTMQDAGDGMLGQRGEAKLLVTEYGD
ncbi:hypothetical protein ASPTUDRAFT_34449 [Aspergillus tubingensis CBS 134.48]|uniref:Uncharacterized protein n=1 Tax=Aspergillus tubingensis (strain CBS 134.48) TaxID=767770 RepID=A0A1L9NJY8_ASPTC|nr:hypothetical protein ASPTUDRAFT_34449 [Aspergillus tubingensis CBS 134.48]